MIKYERCKDVFEQFVDNYDRDNDKISLKYFHILRVADFCEKIAESLNLSKEDIAIAKLTGLLHDIGRFEQVKIYDTYNDLVSVDHAFLGFKILEKNDYINNYIEDEDTKKIVLKAVLEHNKFKVEEDLDERTKMFCNIVRDADKLDILNLYYDNVLHMEDNAGEISPKVLESALRKECIKHQNRKSLIDKYICEICFVFDLNYSYSKQYLYNKGLITNLIERIIKNNPHEKDNLLLIQEKVIEVLIERVEEKC